MKIILLAVLSSFLVNCGAYQPLAKTYKNESLSKENIAVLMGSEASEFFVSFLEYADIAKSQISEFKQYVSILDSQPLVVQMLPGKYLIKLECLHRRLSHLSVNPSIGVDLKAGFTYKIQCDRVPSSKNKIRAYVVNKSITETLEIPFYLK